MWSVWLAKHRLKSLEKDFAAATEELPAIRGCVQIPRFLYVTVSVLGFCAVIMGYLVSLIDDMLMNITASAFHTAMDPKLMGSWNLHTLLLEDLDFFLLIFLHSVKLSATVASAIALRAIRLRMPLHGTVYVKAKKLSLWTWRWEPLGGQDSRKLRGNLTAMVIQPISDPTLVQLGTEESWDDPSEWYQTSGPCSGCECQCGQNFGAPGPMIGATAPLAHLIISTYLSDVSH